MYHPYFRGKQYELITIRDMAAVMGASDFRPIIEPVREGLGGLNKTLKAVADADGKAIVIVNPHHGELSEDGTPLTNLLKEEFAKHPSISAGILLKSGMDANDAMALYAEHEKHSPAFVHAGFSHPQSLLKELGKPDDSQCHIFIERHCVKL